MWRAWTRKSWRNLVAVAVLVGAAWPGGAASQEAAAGIRWEPYELRVGRERVDTVALGRLAVPERRGSAAGRSISLAFVRLPSRSASPAAPIVYLDGGPGGSGVGLARIPAYYRLFDVLREVADVILLSQRGTGLSSPQLVCPLAGPLPEDLFTTRERMLEVLGPSVEACARSWRGRGVDLGGFNTEESADDLEDLRRALGAERLNLLGFSYGTHLGLAALRRHGDRVERAVLIGTEGPEHTYKLPSTPDLQLRHVSWLASQQEAAIRLTPNLYAAVDTLLRRLDRTPLSLTIGVGGGARRTVLLGGDGMRYLLQRDIGDTNDLPAWPAAIRATLEGDYALLTALVERRFREIAGVPLMGILMDCASGADEDRLARIAAETSSYVTGAMTNVWFPEVCRAVPEARLDPGFRAPFTSDVPTLFLSGTLDANTPPHQAHAVSWGWPRATHLVVEHAGHETLMPFEPAQAVILDFFHGRDVRERRIPVPALEFLTAEQLVGSGG